jgi:hypothetical protein
MQDAEQSQQSDVTYGGPSTWTGGSISQPVSAVFKHEQKHEWNGKNMKPDVHSIQRFSPGTGSSSSSWHGLMPDLRIKLLGRQIKSKLQLPRQPAVALPVTAAAAANAVACCSLLLLTCCVRSSRSSGTWRPQLLLLLVCEQVSTGRKAVGGCAVSCAPLHLSTPHLKNSAVQQEGNTAGPGYGI